MITSSKRVVAVLMGGVSPEHEVSLNSGRGVLNALDTEAYDILPVVIGKSGSWRIGDQAEEDIFQALITLRDRGVDCAFIALHGPNGEDGRLQGMLDLLGIPYTGSGCAASALAMDKPRCKAVVQSQGIRVAGHVFVEREVWAMQPGEVAAAVAGDLGFPCVVKPAAQGSSVGIYIPQNSQQLRSMMDQAFGVTDEVLVEEFVRGREVTCAVLDAEPNGVIRALPVTEIRPRNAAFFDYEAKYTPGATEEITPAELDEELTDRIQDMAAGVHQIVGCSGWSRSDFIIDENGPVWLEVNTVPGLTQTSLYPQACAAAGISYQEMVGLFVEAALRRAAWRKGSS